MMKALTHRLIERAITEIFNENQHATADILFAPGYVNHGGLIPDMIHGPEAIKVAAALFRRAFPKLHITILETQVVDDMAWVRWIARSTCPTARDLSASIDAGTNLVGVTRCRVVERQIVESWTDWDRDAAVRNLGRSDGIQDGNANQWR